MKYPDTEHEVLAGDIVKCISDYDFYEVIAIHGEQIKAKKQVSSKEEILQEYIGLFKPAGEEFKDPSKLKKKLLIEHETTSYGDEFGDRYLEIFFYNHMKFCGCGDPESNLSMVGEILEQLEKFRDLSWEEKVERRNSLLGPKQRIHEFMLQSLDAWGLLEHGGSVWGAWLSAEGKELLAHLRMWEGFNKQD